MLLPVSAETDKKMLGEWWEKSSLTYDIPADALLIHLTGTTEFNNFSGNVDGYSFDLEGRFALRMGRFTNTAAIAYSGLDINGEAVGQVSLEKYLFNDGIKFDILTWLYAETGLILFRDESGFIDYRTTCYGGFGIDLLDMFSVNTASHTLSVFGAYGHESEEYTVSFDDADFPVIYFSQRWNWQINERMILREDFQYLSDTNADKNRWNFRVLMEFPVTKHIAFQIAHESDCQSDPLPAVKGRDDKQTVAIKFTYPN